MSIIIEFTSLAYLLLFRVADAMSAALSPTLVDPKERWPDVLFLEASSPKIMQRSAGYGCWKNGYSIQQTGFYTNDATVDDGQGRSIAAMIEQQEYSIAYQRRHIPVPLDREQSPSFTGLRFASIRDSGFQTGGRNPNFRVSDT